MTTVPEGSEELAAALRTMQDRIRDEIVATCEGSATEKLSRIAGDWGGDTQYALDLVSDRIMVEALTPFAERSPLILIAEGLKDGALVLPAGAEEKDASWRVIADPIDGTRGLMYQKRSAWSLAAAAPNRGPETGLADLVLAVQTEIPLVKQHLSDQLACIRGRGVQATRVDRIRGGQAHLELRPSSAGTIEHGYSAIVRIFPGARDELAAIDEELVDEVLGPAAPGKARCFEDQYPSTGGQLYELLAGHDRFIADLRPLMAPLEKRRGRPPGLCAHPYDICTFPIAEELGVLIATPDGGPLSAPLDLETGIAWVGYANDRIRQLVETPLRECLRRRGLLSSGPG